jgi:hypothetical protein
MKTIDEKEFELKSLGFYGTNIGMTNDKYLITYVQIDECKEKEWENFINAIKLYNNNGKD